MTQVQTTGFKPFCAPERTPDRGAVQRSLRDSVAGALDIEARGRGIHGLAVSLRDKLAATDGGPEAVSSVLETINRALDDAAATLVTQGVSQEQVDASVARFRSKLTRELNELIEPAQPEATEKSAIAAREVVKERFSLDILTAEGDKVSIRFKSLQVTDVAAATVSNETGSVTKLEANVISRGRFKVEVDGNLNEAERTAIADLLDKVDDIATDFFGGDVQAAFSAAARVSLDNEALSAYDLKLSYSRSLSAVKTYASNARPGSQPAEPVKLPAETPKPVETAPAAMPTPVTTSPAAEAAVVPAAEPVATTDPVMPPASEGVPTNAAAVHNAVKTSSAYQTITSFATDVLERLDSADESKATKFSLRWKVEFMIKAFGSVALNPVEQAAADALGIALKDLTPRI